MFKNLAAATLLAVCAFAAHADEAELTAGAQYNKDGFTAAIIKERLWVFKNDSKELADYKESGIEPGISAMLIGEGPDGMTMKAPTADILTEYQAVK